jgi:PIN domain nuclease of toxin-antitoxin system
MKLLLDTHVVLWWLDNPNLLSIEAHDAIAEPANDVFVSSVVAWEIAIKRSLGKLTAPAGIESAIVDTGFEELPVRLSHAWSVETLPAHHRDPFDRMLIAQAMADNCTLVSRDAAMADYTVPIIVA